MGFKTILKRVPVTLGYGLSFVVVTGTLYWWFAQSQPSGSNWTLENEHLPDKYDLQQRIDQALYLKQSGVDQTIGADIERIIDPQAMEAKLAGLTKTVTLSREPTTEELQLFFQRNHENYREASKFAYSQLTFPFANHGGLATAKAQQALSNIKANNNFLSVLDEPPEEVFKTSLQLDDLYGQGFGDKLLDLITDYQGEALPCWSDPVTSKMGAHILCFKQVTVGAVPELESVRSQVINDWRYWVSEEQP